MKKQPDSVRPFRSREEYLAATYRVDELIDVVERPDSPEADEMTVLLLLIKEYDSRHYKLPKLSTQDVIRMGYCKNAT
jgi:HTH-type transcriptional regulator/antitoxin HigA